MWHGVERIVKCDGMIEKVHSLRVEMKRGMTSTYRVSMKWNSKLMNASSPSLGILIVAIYNHVNFCPTLLLLLLLNASPLSPSLFSSSQHHQLQPPGRGD